MTGRIAPPGAALALFLNRTRLSRAFRATSDDPDAARLMGIDHRRIYGIALGIAFATVALAGVRAKTTSRVFGALVIVAVIGLVFLPA